MPLSLAAIIFQVRSRSDDTWFAWLVVAAVVVSPIVKMFVQDWWPNLVRWRQGKQSRNWPTVSAIIDIAVVTKEMRSAGRSVYYVYPALLTYSYRNPDLQTGDYNRTFDTEEDAKDWVGVCKGLIVSVHVAPSDPTRSTLRTEELEAAIAKRADVQVK